MAKMELTKEELEFLVENVSRLNIPLGHENGATIARVGFAVMEKLSKALQAHAKEPEEQK